LIPFGGSKLIIGIRTQEIVNKIELNGISITKSRIKALQMLIGWGMDVSIGEKVWIGFIDSNGEERGILEKKIGLDGLEVEVIEIGGYLVTVYKGNNTEAYIIHCGRKGSWMYFELVNRGMAEIIESNAINIHTANKDIILSTLIEKLNLSRYVEKQLWGAFGYSRVKKIVIGKCQELEEFDWIYKDMKEREEGESWAGGVFHKDEELDDGKIKRAVASYKSSNKDVIEMYVYEEGDTSPDYTITATKDQFKIELEVSGELEVKTVNY
jgi:hypothetical protein